MAVCELCGSQSQALTPIKVAGSTMSVCNSCKSMGKEQFSTQKSHTFKRRIHEKTQEEVVSNYSSMINSALAKKGLQIQQLARMLNIKESTLNKFFTGKIKPDIETAKKLERFFEIRLVEEVSSSSQNFSEDVFLDDDDNSSLSLGDLIKKQMK
jgi:putative transcription factor